MTKNETAELYFKKIKALLLCPKTEKEKLLTGLRSDVADYLEDHPAATVEELENRFGTPETIADSYQSTMSEAEIRNKLHHKQMIAIAIVIAIGLLLLAAIIGTAIYFARATADVPEYYVIEEVTGQSVPPEVWEEASNNPDTAWA